MVKIGKYSIGSNSRPFIVAELSGNHNQSLETALKLVEAAANAGAHGLKIQTYTPDTMTINSNLEDFRISDQDSLWCGRTLYDLYEEAQTPWEWHIPIFNLAKKLGMVAFSTPFDETAVDFLEELKVPCYKISSFENTDLRLIKRVAKTKKPLIISTGMASISELGECVSVARDNGCKELILLKCTSSYPASPKNSNLLTIPHLKSLFNCEVGLSDHTLGVGVSVASVALGSTFIEKHFTLDRLSGGVDSAFSIEPNEMKLLVQESENAWNALGEISYGPGSSELTSTTYRRSLYAVRDIRCGEKFDDTNIRAIRPGFGLAVKYYDLFIGRAANVDITKGTKLTWDHL